MSSEPVRAKLTIAACRVVEALQTSPSTEYTGFASPLVNVGSSRWQGPGEPPALLLVLVDLLFNGGDGLVVPRRLSGVMPHGRGLGAPRTVVNATGSATGERV
jgi:hypothetical protein